MCIRDRGNINLVHADRQAAQVQVGGLIGRITAGTSVSNSYAFVTLVAEPESRGPAFY